jgi:hypothetical protein
MTLRNPNEPTFWRKQHQPFVSTMLHTYYTRFTVKEIRFLKYYFLKLGTRCYNKQELMQLLPNTVMLCIQIIIMATGYNRFRCIL